MFKFGNNKVCKSWSTSKIRTPKISPPLPARTLLCLARRGDFNQYFGREQLLLFELPRSVRQLNDQLFGIDHPAVGLWNPLAQTDVLPSQNEGLRRLRERLPFRPKEQRALRPFLLEMPIQVQTLLHRSELQDKNPLKRHKPQTLPAKISNRTR